MKTSFLRIPSSTITNTSQTTKSGKQEPSRRWDRYRSYVDVDLHPIKVNVEHAIADRIGLAPEKKAPVHKHICRKINADTAFKSIVFSAISCLDIKNIKDRDSIGVDLEAGRKIFGERGIYRAQGTIYFPSSSWTDGCRKAEVKLSVLKSFC